MSDFPGDRECVTHHACDCIVAKTRRLDAAHALVLAQAEDEGLWFIPETAVEAYLQQELRRLHAAVEGASDGFKVSNDAIKESSQLQAAPGSSKDLELGEGNKS